MSFEMNSILDTQFDRRTTHAQARATQCRNRLAQLSVFELTIEILEHKLLTNQIINDGRGIKIHFQLMPLKITKKN
jgi:hypothetical protein